MHIFEKDLFDFIFFPKEIDKDKYSYIKKYAKHFRSELSFLIKTFEHQKFLPVKTPLRKIKEKIRKY